MLIEKGYAKVKYVKRNTINDITVVKNGIKLIIPAKAIKPTGFIKCSVLKRISNLTVENLEYLNRKYGVTAELIHGYAA